MLASRAIKDYLKDINNIIDIARGTFCILYFFLYLLDIDRSASAYILVILTTLSFVRGITYFTLFSGTRYLTRLIKEVIIDMRAFFVIFLYTTTMFCLLF
jgi:hypothetical protein